MPKFGYIEGKKVCYIKCESRDLNVIDAALKEMVAKNTDRFGVAIESGR